MKNWKIYLYLLLTYVAMHISSIFLAEFLVGYFQGKPDMTDKVAAYNGVAWSFFIVNLIAAFIFLLLILPNKKFMDVFKGKKSSIGNAILWGFIGFFLAMGGQMLAASIEKMLGIELGSDNTAMLSDIARLSPIMIIPMVIFAPLLEEIVFRRVLFGGIYTKTNFWIAAIVSGFVFAAVHQEFEHLLMYLAPAFIFSYLYYRTKRLLTPIIAHCLMNGFVALVQLNGDKIQNYLENLQEMKQTFIIFFHF